MNNEEKYLKEHFLCENILRHLPNRRVVLSGQWQNQAVIAKIFVKTHRQYAKDFSRELFGYTAMQHCLPEACPALLHQAILPDFTILIYEKIDGCTLNQIWHTYSKEKKYATMAQFIPLIRKLHDHGFLHEDPHFGNILIRNNEIFLLDYGSIRETPKTLAFPTLYGLYAKYRNLALILSQIHPKDIDHGRLLKEYQADSQPQPTVQQNLLQQWIKYRVHIRKKKFLKKIFRNCSLVVKFRQKDFYGHYLRQFEHNLTTLLKNPNIPFEQDLTPLLKNGNSNTVTTYFVDNVNTVVKRYNVKTPLHFLRKRFKSSRAKRSWRNAHLLQFYGINTAAPIAWLQCKKWGLNYKAFFISAYLNGPHALDYLASRANPQQREIALAKMKNLLQSLHNLGFTHRDIKATNIIFVEDEPYLIDLDTLSTCKIRNWLGRRFKKDWRRFERNWESPYAH